MSIQAGRLAIWNTCTAGKEHEYETWYQTEHLAERLSIPGFQRGRRYEAINHCNVFFTCYETDNPAVLTSDAYLHRVNHPTPMTALIMREAFTDMSRTICRLTYSLGRMRGVFVATLKMTRLPDENLLRDCVSTSTHIASIARIEGWQAVDDEQSDSTEARLRGGDKQIEACLIVETLREKECRLLMEYLAAKFGVPEERTDLYRLLCELDNEWFSR